MEKNLMQPPFDRIAWHWYDLTCPFCYVSKSRSEMLQSGGFHVVALPFQAHPDVPPEGLAMGERRGQLYMLLEAEAQQVGLPLRWPARLPNSGYALALAEQVRRHVPDVFGKVKDRLYAAHFALGEDLGAKETVHRCLLEYGIGAEQIQQWTVGNAHFQQLAVSQRVAEHVGVRGTPAWIVNDQLITGLQPRAYFERVIRTTGDSA